MACPVRQLMQGHAVVAGGLRECAAQRQLDHVIGGPVERLIATMANDGARSGQQALGFLDRAPVGSLFRLRQRWRQFLDLIGVEDRERAQHGHNLGCRGIVGGAGSPGLIDFQHLEEDDGCAGFAPAHVGAQHSRLLVGQPAIAPVAFVHGGHVEQQGVDAAIQASGAQVGGHGAARFPLPRKLPRDGARFEGADDALGDGLVEVGHEGAPETTKPARGGLRWVRKGRNQLHRVTHAGEADRACTGRA